MPLTEPEKRAFLARNEAVEEMHHHEFKGAALACGECGLAAADDFHSWTPPTPVLSISETEGLRLQARNDQNVTIYRHAFDLCESTGNCRECQLPLADDLHGVRGTAGITRNVDIVNP